MTTLANTRKSSSLIKKYLQTKYGVTFKVKTEKYSMGSSLNIDWTCGPSEKVIDAEVRRLEYGTFDSMTDLSGIKDKSECGMIINGYRIETQKHVFCDQHIPKEIIFQIAQIASHKWKFGTGNEIQPTLPEIDSIDELHTSFKERYGDAWTWSEMVRKNWQVRNFVTDNVESIIIKDVTMNDDIFHTWVVSYEVDGVEYTTNDLMIKEPAVKKEKVIVVNDVRMVDYSDKAVAVVGNTYEIKDSLKEIGGRFNKFLNVDGKTVAGWVFPKTKESEVADVLINYSQE